MEFERKRRWEQNSFDIIELLTVPSKLNEKENANEFSEFIYSFKSGVISRNCRWCELVEPVVKDIEEEVAFS